MRHSAPPADTPLLGNSRRILASVVVGTRKVRCARLINSHEKLRCVGERSVGGELTITLLLFVDVLEFCAFLSRVY